MQDTPDRISNDLKIYSAQFKLHICTNQLFFHPCGNIIYSLSPFCNGVAIADDNVHEHIKQIMAVHIVLGG